MSEGSIKAGFAFDFLAGFTGGCAMIRTLLGGSSNSEQSERGARNIHGSPAQPEYFKLSCQSPEQLAALLRARHGLGDLKSLYAAFRSDPGEEVHPARLRTSSDGFALVESPRPTTVVEKGWLLVERFQADSGEEVYSRMRSFKSYPGALAEFCSKLEICPIGSLEVSEGAQSPGRAELRFEGLNRTMSLMTVR